MRWTLRRGLLAGLVVVLLAIGTAIVVDRRSEGSAPCAPARTSAALELKLPPSPRVLIFGDSYTQGAGALPNKEGFAFLVGPELGWQVTVDGVGSTGYVAAGRQHQGTYQQRLAASADGVFDLVVLQGSSNDTRQPLAKLPAAVEATLSTATSRYPGAQLVLMGPAALYGTAPPEYLAVRDVLQRVAAGRGVVFIDPLAEHWFAKGESKSLANPRNGHPSNAGHARMADRFVEDVRSRSVVAAPPCAT